MKNEETLPRRFGAQRGFFIHHSSFCISAPSLSGAGDDARYFQISVPVRVARATGLCRPATRRTELWARTGLTTTIE